MKLFRISGEEIDVIPERSYRDKKIAEGEFTLEQFLVNHPEVIPREEIDQEDPPNFMTIKSQAGVTAGSMDILLVDHKATPTVVEVKLIDNREIRRSVLAQGIEYLAHLRTEWTPDRLVEEGQRFWNDRGRDFESEAQDRLGLPIDSDFMDRIAANIDANRMRLIIASDIIPPELRTVIDFLNNATTFEVYGLEVRLFATEESYRILAPRLVGFPRKIRPSVRWDQTRFFSALEATRPADEIKLAKDLLDFGVQTSGRGVDWGVGKSRGSFTARLSVGDERFSLFSVYTTGQFSLNMGWNAGRLARFDSELSEKYRIRAKEKLSIEFERNSWEQGWPMGDLG